MLLVRAGLSALDFDPAKALSLAQRALQALPDSTPARSLLAAAQLGVGDAAAALRNMRDTRSPSSPDDQYLIALQTRRCGCSAMSATASSAITAISSCRCPSSRRRPGATSPASCRISRRASTACTIPNGHALLFQSLRHGTETTQDLTRSTDPAVRGLFAAFAAPIGRYLEHIGAGADALRRRNDGRWRFNGSWSVRLRDRGFHMSHVHPRGWISSAFYVELPDLMSRRRHR